MANNKGLFDELGIGSADERAILEAQRGQAGSTTQQGYRALGRQASPLIYGAANALGGLVTGKEDGRSLKGAGRNFRTGAMAQDEKMVADAAGLTVEQMRARREVRKLTSEFDDDGSFEKRIALLRKIASTANRYGDAETVSAALRKLTEVEKERSEFAKLGLANEKEARQQSMEKEIGLEAELVDGGKGKAVRINEGPDAGKYLFIQAGEPDQVVRGGDLLIEGVTNPTKLSALDAKRNTVEYWAAKNGAGQGQIAKMRAGMDSMRENTQIVSNIAGLLTTANDPQGILATQGKAAIAADKSISFVESVSNMATDPRLPQNNIAAQTAITWDDGSGPKRISAAGQRQRFMSVAGNRKDDGILLGILNSIAGERGAEALNSLDDYLPPNIRGNARLAEQYWANVMELAYLDARLMEPSNRGLSDNDVKMALKRIGADTANPISFAERQLTVIDTKLLPALANLGTDFSTAPEVDITPQMVADFVYNPERIQQVRDVLAVTRKQLIEVIEQGRRGENREVPNPDNEFEPTKTIDELKAERDALKAERDAQ
jgi:hypothetical protein